MPAEHHEPLLSAPIARARDAGARAAAILRDGAKDLLLPDAVRLDDRLRAALHARLRAGIGTLEREVRLAAARRLADMGAADAAERLLANAGTALDRLRETALLRDTELMAELIGSARLALLADGLPPGASAGAERPSLVVRLAECPEPDVARAAAVLLAAANAGDDAADWLTPLLAARLTWWVAAALRGELGGEPRADHALADAAVAVVDGLTDAGSDRAAMRLAEVIAARPDELAGLLVESLGDRRPALFTALLAVAGALSFSDARAIVTEPDGARLWLFLQARGVERTAIARIGVALAAADGARDLERFADEIDEVVAVAPEAAAAVFAPLTLPEEYRRALAALDDAS